jgi:hypothetical protein
MLVLSLSNHFAHAKTRNSRQVRYSHLFSISPLFPISLRTKSATNSVPGKFCLKFPVTSFLFDTLYQDQVRPSKLYSAQNLPQTPYSNFPSRSKLPYTTKFLSSLFPIQKKSSTTQITTSEGSFRHARSLSFQSLRARKNANFPSSPFF